MNLFKAKRFELGKYWKSKAEKRGEETPRSESEADEQNEEVEDLLTRELKSSSSMVLVPEGDGGEEEENAGIFHNRYCERMFFFDEIILANHHHCRRDEEIVPAPRRNRYRSLSLKRKGIHLTEERRRLHERYDERDYLETAYVAHLALTWEALSWHYSRLKRKVSYYCAGAAGEAFQQFQVLLQRFLENEPFEPGSRVQIYARARAAMPKLLQVPSLQVLEVAEVGSSDSTVSAVDFLKILELSFLAFRHFIKAEKTKPVSRSEGLRWHRLTLSEREMKLKGLIGKKSKKATGEDVELLFAVVSRVLRMARLSEDQMQWCEERMNRLDSSHGKMQRHGPPLLFPS